MDKTRLYHVLASGFGALLFVQGALQLSESFTLIAGFFVVGGLGVLVVSGLALYRPDLDDTVEPATWKLVLLAVGILLILAGTAIEYL